MESPLGEIEQHLSARHKEMAVAARSGDAGTLLRLAKSLSSPQIDAFAVATLSKSSLRNMSFNQRFAAGRAIARLLPLMSPSMSKWAEPFCLYSQDPTRSESLMRAAREGDFDKIKQLAAEGVSVNARDSEDATPLSRAAREGQHECMSVLMSLGAEPFPTIQHGLDAGSCALWQAVASESPRCVRLLLAGVGSTRSSASAHLEDSAPDLQDSQQARYVFHALTYAIGGRSAEIVECLCAHAGDQLLLKAALFAFAVANMARDFGRSGPRTDCLDEVFRRLPQTPEGDALREKALSLMDSPQELPGTFAVVESRALETIICSSALGKDAVDSVVGQTSDAISAPTRANQRYRQTPARRL